MKSPSLSAFYQTLLHTKGSFVLEKLSSGALAFLLSELLAQEKKDILVVTKGTKDTLFEDLTLFLKKAPIEIPAWETLPFEEIAPSADILGKRFEAFLSLIQKTTPQIILTPLASLMQKVVAKEHLTPFLSEWKKGDTIPFSSLVDQLSSLGYKRAPIVSDKGEFALRGGILDIFPVAATDPYRIDFLDDTIEEIRTFDPVGQISIAKVPSLFLSPKEELSLLKKEKLASLFDYLSKDCLLVFDDLVALEETFSSFKKLEQKNSPYLCSFEEIFEKCPRLFLTKESLESLSEIQALEKREGSLQKISFEMFSKQFEAIRFFHPFTSPEMQEGDTAIFVSENETEDAQMEKVLSLTASKTERGALSSGFRIIDAHLTIFSYLETMHKTRVRRQKWRSSYHTPASEFHELTPGSLVVHFHSGIGKFLGIEKKANHLGILTEFLVIEYAENSKLYVPLSNAHLVSRYIGVGESGAPLSALGNKKWQKARISAQTQIVGYANDLLKLYAEREASGGFFFAEDSEELKRFEEEFPYEETQDQLLAIQEIKRDMCSTKAMDRLILGDVGFGKTEVAMRAAFKAVVDGGKQVAVLVPTTVLAMQHFETFSERMQGFGLEMGLICRFCKAKEVKETLHRLKKGEIDILIGTHKLLSQGVEFKNLGLMIVDEEQRFGVRAKEHLKKKKVGIDCLTLSATPIPRTLYMSLVHARDMSVIHTPPQDRLPIKTILAETELSLIQNALLREFAREGQAYYIHNRVETIYKRKEEIEKLVPHAKVGIVHGQMDAKSIDEIFHLFKQGNLDLLFATTIIENGIDVPNANTIFIDRADTYGLADLHQLRGRVGRWNRSAFAYFLVPKNMRLSEVSQKRLNALISSGGGSSGMKVAMRDLEIRGAGDLLGVQQSGQVSSIGFHLYCKLLKKAIDALKAKKPISFLETKMEFPFDARLSEEYINEVSLRMELYFRIGEAASFDALDQIFAEMEDRFGSPPPCVTWLYHLSRVRTFCTQHKITAIKFHKLSFEIEKLTGAEVEKKSFLMPDKVQTPKALEEHVLTLLKS